MKSSKKLFLGIFLLILIAAIMTSLFTVSADSAHTYKAYKIFTGTQATGSANLAVTGWGDGVDGAKLLAALKKSTAFGSTNPFASCTGAADVAIAMADWTDSSDKAMAFAKLAYENKSGEGTTVKTGDTLNAGYYLIVDTTATNGALSEVKNLALLQLTQKETLNIAAKVDIPTVIKKVKDTNDSVASSTTDWQDSADFDIGDTVSFKLEATLPANLSVFPAYKLVFHDTTCTGLTVDLSSVKVYIGTSKTPLESGYKVSDAVSTKGSFEVTIYDVIASGGTASGTVRVEYTATLNKDAVIGSVGNPNVVYLEYSNNPNWSKSILVTIDETNHMVSISEKDGEIDTVTVDGTVITDKTQKETYITAVKNLVGGPCGPEKAETGKTAEDKVIVFTYQLSVSKTDGTNPLSGANFTLYKFIPKEGGTDSYNKVTGTWTALTQDATLTTETTFVWKGLDDGTYKLAESTVPNGYNGMSEQIFAVNATHDVTSDTPALTALSGDKLSGTITFTRDTANADTLKTTVINTKGSTLPETGGIGTVIFYVSGSVLVVGAIVLLITKKRMSRSK